MFVILARAATQREGKGFAALNCPGFPLARG
jgi:hypothetical protein